VGFVHPASTAGLGVVRGRRPFGDVDLVKAGHSHQITRRCFGISTRCRAFESQQLLSAALDAAVFTKSVKGGLARADHTVTGRGDDDATEKIE